jgi:hypothetical protein
MKKATTTKKTGKRAAAAIDPASLARMRDAEVALKPLMKMGERGEVGICQVIRYIVGTYPLLRREAVELLTKYGFSRATVTSNFQCVRSGVLSTPKIDVKK